MNKTRIVAILDKISEWALYILIFCLPFSKSIIEISFSAAFFAWVVKKIITKDFSVKKTPLDWLLLAFFAVNALSIVNSDLKMLVLKALFTKCLKYIILYFIVVETIDSDVKLKNLLKMAFISAVIITIDSYIQYYGPHHDVLRLYRTFKYVYKSTIIENRFLGFPTGPFPFPNDLSAWMLMIIMPAMSIFLWDMKAKRSRWMLGAFLAPFAFLFYLANTRSAWLGFFVSFFLLLLILKKKKVIIAIAIISAMSLPFLPKEKLNDIIGFSSMRDRAFMWRTGHKIFLQHPIIGNGLNTFFVKFKEFREDEFKNRCGSQAHNGYLQIAADTGLVGLAVFLLLLGRAAIAVIGYIKQAKEIFHKMLALGLSMGILAFLIHSFFDTNLHSLPLVVLLWFSLALLISMNNIKGGTITE